MSLVSLGAGLYWAGIMTSPLALNGAASALPWQTALALFLAACIAAIAVFRPERRFLLPVSVAALALCAVGGLGMLLATSGAAADVPGRLRNVGGSLLMLLWSARFVSVTRSRAFAEVSGAALLALALQCAAIAVDQASGPLPGIFSSITSLYWVASAGVLTYLQVREPVENFQVERDSCTGRTRVEFIFSRIALGLGLGALQAALLAAGSGPTAYGSAVSADSSGVLALLCLVCLAGGWGVGNAMRFAPLFPIAVLTLPVIGAAGGAARVELMYPCLWLAWICLSSVQLSELKYFLGKRPLGLAFGEKALVLSSILVGQVCGTWLFGRFDEPESALVAAVPALVTGVLLLCLYSSTSLMRLASMRDHEAFVQEVIAESREALAYVYRQIAEDFGLSVREAQVLPLLAQGHTQGHVAQELGVASGTVRSHVNHIYTKTRCHSREDLLALVKKYQAEKR